MSLNTIIEIGRTFRNQKVIKKAICHHSYANRFQNSENLVILTIPVDSEMNFRFDRIAIGYPENLRDELFYLTTNVSSNDRSASKYLFGDITYSLERTLNKKNGELKKEANEKGNFTLSYLAGKEDSDTFLCQKAIELKQIALFGHKPQTKEEKRLWKELKPILNSRIGVNEEIELSIAAKNKLREKQLYAFWFAFCKNFEVIQNCMLYAPAVTIDNINDTESLIEDYQKVIFNRNKDKDEWTFLKDKTFSELTSHERNTLKEYKKHSVFIHFSFEDKMDIDEDDAILGKHWYEQKEAFDLTVKTISSQAVIKQSPGNQKERLVPTVSVFRTLCSGNEKNDIQFPGFSHQYSYKSFGFTDEQFEDFLYTGKIIRTPRRRIYNTNIELYVFPHNDNDKFNAEEFSNFFFKKGSEINFLSDDPLDNEFQKFDFVFSDNSGQTIRDLVEISGIEESLYKKIRERIEVLENDVKQLIEKETPFRWNIKIEKAFSDILDTTQEDSGRIVLRSKVDNDKKRNPYPPYQYHLMRVMPKIYTETYYRDDALLPKVIEKIEYSVRNTKTDKGDYSNFQILKYDLMLLMKIQNNKNDRYMELTNSKSYLLGVKIGRLAKPLGKAISSFEKNYVGLLSRRIATKNDCIRFMNEICEKLTIHDLYTGSITEACSELAQISLSDYSKEELAFGFFEGYFSYIAKDSEDAFLKRIKKIMDDFKENEKLSDALSQLNEIAAEISK